MAAASRPASEPAPQEQPPAVVEQAPSPAEPKPASPLERAQAMAPHLDQAFVDQHQLDDDYLERVARGEEPPPPYNGPDFTSTDLHRTPGGWVAVPHGTSLEDAGKAGISR